MNKLLKEREACKASEASKASKSSQASYASIASIASPQLFILPKISFRGSESAPRRPGDLFGDPPSNFGKPRKPQISYYLKSASGAVKSAPRRPGDLFGYPPKVFGSIIAIILSRRSARKSADF